MRERKGREEEKGLSQMTPKCVKNKKVAQEAFVLVMSRYKQTPLVECVPSKRAVDRCMEKVLEKNISKIASLSIENKSSDR